MTQPEHISSGSSGAGPGAGAGGTEDLAPVLVAPAPSNRFPAFFAHLMPFHIDFDGPAPIDTFLVFDTEPNPQESTAPRPILTSAFRGRKLYGTPLSLPPNWAAALVLKPTAAEKSLALERQQRAIIRTRVAEERERVKTEKLEARRAEIDAKRAELQRERDAAREARRAEKAAEREEKKRAREAAKAAAKEAAEAARAAGNPAVAVAEELGPEEDEEEEEEEHFDDDDDVIDSLRYYEHAIDDSADEYDPKGVAARGAGDEDDLDETGRARKKPRPRPRPKPAPKRSALSNGGLSASLGPPENPHGLRPPSPHQSMSALSQFQQAIVGIAQQSFSMDDDEDEDDPHQHAASSAQAYGAQDPTAYDENDPDLPSEHRRQRGDILDHNVVAIHATVDVEMDALAIAASRAAQTALLSEEQLNNLADTGDGSALDPGLGRGGTHQAQQTHNAELPGTPGADEDDDGLGDGSTSAYFGQGGGRLVGGGLFDSFTRKKQSSSSSESALDAPGPSGTPAVAAASSTPDAATATVEAEAVPVPPATSSPASAPAAPGRDVPRTRSIDRLARPVASTSSPLASLLGKVPTPRAESVNNSTSASVAVSAGGAQSSPGEADVPSRRQALSSKRSTRSLGGPTAAAAVDAAPIPASDDEEGEEDTKLSIALTEDKEEVSPTRRSSRISSQSPTKSPRTAAAAAAKKPPAVVYGTGEKAAAAKRAQEAELSRRKSGRKAPLPKRFTDDAPAASTSSSPATAASSSASRSTKTTLRRSTSSGTLAGKAASSGANAMRQWLAGTSGRKSGGGGAPASVVKKEAEASGQVPEEDDEVDESPIKCRASSSSLRRLATRKASQLHSDEDEEDWEKESASERKKRLRAAPLEVVIQTEDAGALQKESRAGGWRRSESVSPRKATTAANSSSRGASVGTDSPSSTRSRTKAAAESAAARIGSIQTRPRQRVVTAVTSSGRVAVRPARYSPEPGPSSRSGGGGRLTRRTSQPSWRQRLAKKDVAGGEEVDDSSDEEEDDDVDEDGEREGGDGTGKAKNKRVWTKRWSYEERIDVMLGDTFSLGRARSHRPNTSDALDGLVKLRVVGRLGGDAKSVASAASVEGKEEDEEVRREREIREASGTSGIVLWNADGPLDDDDDAMARTVHELLGVWSLVHDY
ncbi:hypothetical protein V8E36_005436 [Tilletia maclaganii]